MGVLPGAAADGGSAPGRLLAVRADLTVRVTGVVGQLVVNVVERWDLGQVPARRHRVDSTFRFEWVGPYGWGVVARLASLAEQRCLTAEVCAALLPCVQRHVTQFDYVDDLPSVGHLAGSAVLTAASTGVYTEMVEALAESEWLGQWSAPAPVSSPLPVPGTFHGKDSELVAELATVCPAVLSPPPRCPACGLFDQEQMATLAVLIVHLNDHHLWSRERVADWLETLDVDLTVTAQLEGQP